MLTEKVEKSKWLDTILARMRTLNPYSLFNILFAVYFLILNIKLILGIDFILGNQSVPKDQLQDFYDWNLLTSFFNLPDIFFKSVIIFNIILSFTFLFNRHVRWLMLLAWIGMTIVFLRIPSHKSVHIEYLGWLMMINVFISDKIRMNKEPIPDQISWATWIFFSLSYFLSGIAKLRMPEWNTGNAIYYILKTDVARISFLREWMLQMRPLTAIPTYFVLTTELVGLFLIWTRKTRIILLLASAFFHIMILCFLKIADLTIAILIFHGFLLLTFYRPQQINEL